MTRFLGPTAAALFAAATAWGQAPPAPPAAPGVPVTPPAAPGAPPAAAPVDPKLNAHLNGWELKMRDTVNFRSDFALTRTDGTFKDKKREYTGSVLCMKPGLARLRLASTANPADFEAFICNGTSVYEYNGSQKTMTEYKIAPNPGGGGDNLMLDFLGGMKAQAALQRFDLTLFKEDANYIYLDIKPRLAKDAQEFSQVRFALFGPTTPFPYLPAQVWMLKPNGDSELWKFTNPQVDLPNIVKKYFEAEAPPKDWQVKQAPPAGGVGAAPAPPGTPRVARPAGP